MKRLLITITLFISFAAISNAQYADIAPKLKSKNWRKIINRKMDGLMKRVSAETGCSRDEISYEIIETFVLPYSNPAKQLPKTLVLTVCDRKMTYLNTSFTGDYRLWELANWVLNGVNAIN